MSFVLPSSRQKWFKDFDGIWATTKREDGIEIETFDFSDRLETGETIASVAWEEDGADLSAASNTTTTATVTVTGSGEAEVTITTSAGRKLQERFRWVGKDTVFGGDYDG
jgi:hypothetical protein